MPATTPQVRSGKLRAIGIGSLKRKPIFPDVPTIAEAGRARLRSRQLVRHRGPAGTPPAIVERLHREITAVQDLPEVQKQFDADGAAIIRMTPQRSATTWSKEMNKWERVVKEGGIKAE